MGRVSRSNPRIGKERGNREVAPAVGVHHTVIIMRFPPILATAATLVFSSGCVHVKIDPIEVRAVVDVNVKVDRALDDFFGDLDKQSTTIMAAPEPNVTS